MKIEAIMATNVIYVSSTGERKLLPKGASVKVKHIKPGTLFSDMLGNWGTYEQDAYIAHFGMDFVDILRAEFKTYD